MRRIVPLLLSFLLLICLILPQSRAEVGNFAGDSDYDFDDYVEFSDNSGWDDSSNWDNDDDFGGIIFGDPSTDVDFGRSEDGFSAFSGILLVVAIFEAVIILKQRKEIEQMKKPSSRPVNLPPVSLDALLERDPKFNTDAFLENVRNLYVQLQQAWMAKDWEPMRAHLTDDFYNQLNRQVNDYISKEQTNHIERVSVLSAAISAYKQKDDMDLLTVRLNTRIVDYVTDDKTGDIVRGNPNKELFMTYEWTMSRRMGAVTPDDTAAIHCANCGAPLDAAASTRCPYCGSISKANEYDWTLSAITGISQQS